MGLDVYVGSLTRYYTHDWETAVQQAGRELGVEVQVVRTEEPPVDEITDPDEARELVLAWRDATAAAVGAPLAWDESPEAPYFTDKPGWDAYGSLQVLAAADERGAKVPKRAVEDWSRDRTWQKASGGDAPRYPHLYLPEWWLPGGVPVFQSITPAVTQVAFGSSETLLQELELLNERTLRGTRDDLARWRDDGAEPGGPFEDAARFGLAVLTELARRSVEHRLPMLLYY